MRKLEGFQMGLFLAETFFEFRIPETFQRMIAEHGDGCVIFWVADTNNNYTYPGKIPKFCTHGRGVKKTCHFMFPLNDVLAWGLKRHYTLHSMCIAVNSTAKRSKKLMCKQLWFEP